MNTPLPTPTARSLLSQRFDHDTQRAALAAIRAAKSAVSKLTVEATLALAERTYPAHPLNMAVKLLAHDFEQFQHHLETHTLQCNAVLQAEKVRLKPFTLASSIRLFKVVSEIEATSAALKNADNAREARIKKLTDAGLSAQEVEALCPAVNKGELIAQLAALKAELQAIEKFHRTCDEADLPFGFDATPPPTWGTVVYIPTEPA